MEELVGLLEHECSLAMELRIQLALLQQLIDSGEIRQVEEAADEVSQCLIEVRESEWLRESELARLARSHGLAPEASLDDLTKIASPAVRAQIQAQANNLGALAADIELAGKQASSAAGACLSDLETFGALRLQVLPTGQTG
ncbi:MAG: hypothetical protein ACC652_03015 [Acidimicrobiales bacterium]